MQLEPLADQAGVAISYDYTNGWLYADWYGVHNAETSRAGCLLLLAQLRLHPTSKILNDNSRIVHIAFELSEWSAWWLGEMRAAGLKALAWVYPPGFTRQKATDAILLRVPQPVIVTFGDLASAYSWLQAQHP